MRLSLLSACQRYAMAVAIALCFFTTVSATPIWPSGFGLSVSTVDWPGVPFRAAGKTADAPVALMATLSGTTFDDFNSNGVFDNTGTFPERGLDSVVVKIYSVASPATAICTDTSGADGSWSCVVPDAAADYRVEFTNPFRTYLEAAAYGPDNGSNVQFVNAADADADDINFGSVDPGAYCPTTDLRMAVTCFANGVADGNLDETVIDFDYGVSGGINSDPAAKQVAATANQVGATWGLAWDRKDLILFVSAVERRHAGYGALGPGGIYAIDYTDPNNPVESNFLTVAGAGTDVHTGLPTGGGSTPSYDLASYALVGKQGLGDIDITADGRTMYVTNLNNRTLVEIDIATAAETATYDFPAALCDNAAEVRPWAVKVHQGEVYAGMVCSGEAGGALSGWVLKLEGDGTFSTVTEVDLSYVKDNVWKYNSGPCAGLGFDGPSAWKAWNETWPAFCNNPFGGNDNYLVGNEQPILSDIEFDDDGSLILGFVDRFGLQSGPRNYSNDANDTDVYFPFSGGDILRFCNVGGTLVQEGGAGCAFNAGNAPGDDGMEFYNADDFLSGGGTGEQHYEVSTGGLTLVGNTGEVIFSAFDPVNGVGFPNGVNTGGVRYASNTTGDYTRGLVIYQNSINNPGTFGKTSGLGDLELFCPARPLQIGDLVWFDENNDGIQDANEDGIPNVPIELWLDPDGNTQGSNERNGDEILVATTTTDAEGHYIFSRPGDPNAPTAQNWMNGETEVRQDTFYQMRIADIATQASILAVVADPIVTTQFADTGENSSLRDNNAYDNPGSASVAIATGGVEQNDHNFDLGITSEPEPTIELLARCQCFDVEYDSPEADPLEFLDSIKVTAPAGQTWRVYAQQGVEVVDTFINRDLPLDTLLTEGMPGMYTLNFAHTANVGYTISVTNVPAGSPAGTPGDSLTISNACFQPTVTTPGIVTDLACGQVELELMGIASLNDVTVGGTFTYDVILGPNPGDTIFDQTTYDLSGLPGGTVIEIRGRYEPVSSTTVPPSDNISRDGDQDQDGDGFIDNEFCPQTYYYEITVDDGACPCNAQSLGLDVACSYDRATTTNTFTLSYSASTSEEQAGETATLFVNGVAVGTPATVGANGDIAFDPVVLTEGPSIDNTLTFTVTNAPNCGVSTVFDLVACTVPCDGSAGEVGGNVFLDDNNDGADAGAAEGGQGNVLVRVYDCDNELICEVYTNEAGDWSCDGAEPGEQVRVEYTTPLQPYLEGAFAGPDNRTGVQFLSGGMCNADYAVFDPSNFCNPNPLVFTTCYVNGDEAEGGPDDGALVLTDYDLDRAPGYQALTNQVGGVWGVAPTRTGGPVFTGAFLRRHVGLGPSGLGAIYAISEAGTTGSSVSTLIDLATIYDLGSIDEAARGLGGPNEPSYDVEAFAKTGEIGLGDVEFVEAEQALYTVNLNTKEIIRIDVSAFLADGTAPVAADVSTLPPFPMTCVNGESRPFGIEYDRGELYVGVVCDGSAEESTTADVTANVFRFNGTAWLSVINFPLNYPRGRAADFGSTIIPGEWRAWTDEFDESEWLYSTFSNAKYVAFPQPILADIEFDRDGNMILGFADRGAFQMGWTNYRPDPDEMDTDARYRVIAAGDLIRTEVRNGTYLLESGGTTSNGDGCGPNGDGPDGGEFYCGDDAFFIDGNNMENVEHGEILLGGLAYLPGSDEILVSSMDAEQGTFGTGGIRKLSNVTGEETDALNFYNSGFGSATPATFGKGGGIGDVEILCDPPPIQIGNYAWIDTNRDGLQEGCEPALPGLTVKLYSKPATGTPELIATTVTNATGNYYFSSESAADPNLTWEGTGADTALVTGMRYIIAFCGDSDYDAVADTLNVGGMRLCISTPDATTTGTSNPNAIDSDISELEIDGVILPAYCTQAGETDENNFTFDAGFKPPLEYDLALRKTLSDGQAAGFRPGDQVRFDVEVVNQGDTTVFDLVVGDSIPAGLTYDASGTTMTGTGVLTSAEGSVTDFTNNYLLANDGSFVIDSLAAGDSITFVIAVTIDDVTTSRDLLPLVNYAEIQAFDNDRDPDNVAPFDEDSNPDMNFSNDAGGAPGSEADNFTGGDATGMAGDSTAVTDEDDADPARIPIFDLALRKVLDPASISPTGNYPDNTPVTFNIDVCNQGNDTVRNVVVKDYVPCGLRFPDPNGAGGNPNPDWTNNGPDGGTASAQDSVFSTITTIIAPDSCVQLQIVLEVRPITSAVNQCGQAQGVPDDFLTNAAEVRSFEDTRGNNPPDFDSTPDGTEANDPGGVTNSVSDNILTGNGTGAPGSDDAATDEDDQDGANLDVFDLAIYKVIDSMESPPPYLIGEVVKFNIGVVSQGNIAAQEVSITDLAPEGLSYDPTLGDGTETNASIGWDATVSDSLTLTIDDFTGLVNGDPTASTLGVFDTALVSIYLRINAPTTGEQAEYTNLAELAEGVFLNPMSGIEVRVTSDGDSQYNLGRGNDTGTGPETADDNQTLDDEPGEDIDSQDPAFVNVSLGVALGDTTFIDVNMDGLQDAGDLALANVTVTVYDAVTMMPVMTDIFGNDYNATRRTDAEGAYLFDSLPSGNYYVEFDITTAENFDLYDFTAPNQGMDDAIDSDVAPANPGDDVANSDPTGVIPAGDTVRTLDAGVLCAISVDVPDPVTICATRTVDLAAGFAVLPARLGANFTTDGTGTFLDAAGAEIATGPFALGTAVTFRPSAADALRGFVNITLTSNDPADLTPTSVCAPVSATVRIEVLKVDCGDFFWDGGE